jgi:hypothetical protein
MLTWRENPGSMQVMPPLERHDVASFGGCASSAPVHRQADDIDMPRKIARHVAFHVREVEDDETPDIDNPEHVYRSKHGIDGFVEHLSEVPASVWRSAAVKRPSNCAACHTQADKGNFDERFVRIPSTR